MALASLLGLLGQFGPTLHLVVVEHAACAEHGQWVHVDDDHQAGHGEHQHAEASVDQPEAISQAESDHTHDDCLVCVERRERVLAPWVDDIAEGHVRDLRSSVSDDGSATMKTAVYRYAPKTSPPA